MHRKYTMTAQLHQSSYWYVTSIGALCNGDICERAES